MVAPSPAKKKEHIGSSSVFFSKFSPSIDWLMPTHIDEGDLL